MNEPERLLFQAMPPPPRCPSKTARKLIFGYQGSQFVKLLLGIIFTVIGVPFTLAFCWRVPSDLVLAVTGVRAQAQVLGTRIDTSSTVNDEHPTAVRFEYVVAGQRYTDESSTIHHALTDGLGPGSAVSVEYAPLTPGWARLQGTTRSFFGYFGLIALLFPIVGLLFWVRTVRENNREIRAYTWGRPIAARRVRFEEDRTTSVNGRHPWVLGWEFAVDGKSYSGSLSSMRPSDLTPLASERVPVLYLEDDPSANTVYLP